MPSSRSRYIAVVLLITLVLSVFYTFSSSSSSSVWLQNPDEPQARLHSSSNPNNAYKPIPKVPSALRLTEDDERGGDVDGAGSGRVGNPKLGGVVMPKMVNETQKAELGRSAWRLLHTMVAKFPPSPTKDEQEALLDFIYLFARLYPCGDCARHFQLILRSHPPNVASRDAATEWACEAHNIVNERLGKNQFDCKYAASQFGCGCGDDDAGGKEGGVEVKLEEAKNEPPPPSQNPAHEAPVDAEEPEEEAVEGGSRVGKIDAAAPQHLNKPVQEERIDQKPPKDVLDEGQANGLIKDEEEEEPGQEPKDVNSEPLKKVPGVKVVGEEKGDGGEPGFDGELAPEMADAKDPDPELDAGGI